jgi:membrane fusion protein (multidrug efflux system)
MRLINKGHMIGRVIAGIVISGAVVFGLMHLVAGMAYVMTDDAYVEGRIHTVAPKVGGTVEKVYVVDNQAVKKGEILVQVDVADYEVKVKEAEAVLAAEEARLAEAGAMIKGADAALAVQAATFKQAALDKKRAGRLFTQGVLPQEKMEKADTGFDLAKAQFSAAEQGLVQARAALRLQEALVATRKAALEAARLNLGYTRITAPADGFVTKKSAEDGNMVQPGQPLMAVVALDDVWVLANYKETQLEHVHPGQSVEVRVDTYPGRIFTGKVESLMAGTGAAFSLFPPENALGNYVKIVQRIPLKIVLDKDAGPDHVLRVGMSVVAKIKVKGE